MYDIISIGSATRDVFFSASELKKFKMDDFPTGEAVCFGYGSKIEMKKIVLTSGGGGTNAAVTFARQGLKTANIGVIGQDFNGEDILRELTSEGIDVQYFQKHDDDYTAYSVILVHQDGERTIMSYKGEGQHFDPKRIPLDKLKAKWFFLDSLGGNYEVLEGLVDHAVKNNIKLATNPGGKELAHGLEKLKPFLKHFSIVIMNQEEAAGLTGIDYKKEEEIFKFMDEVIGGIFVMTKGPEGVVVSDGKNIYSAGVPDSPVVERTGAGDAFSSGFVVEYIRSGDIAKAIQFATVNASSVVTQYGAKAGILKEGDWGPWPLIKVDKIQL
ncbi:MAG: carbohydrate kinase family protein [Candidatus Taylorbacteria bacterium]|nr:carbohydrate kinase family protein [Candidatus Taylorbacteria bacterium]